LELRFDVLDAHHGGHLVLERWAGVLTLGHDPEFGDRPLGERTD
jgi:hypothetical protein